MNAIEVIQIKLEDYPQLIYEIDGPTITVPPTTPGGFTVWLTEKNPGFTVGFEGWHEEFFDQGEALNCFAFGLSDRCRLKVVKRGGRACSWTVESWEEGEWRESGMTGLMVFPFWKKKSIEYLSNGVIQGADV